MSKDLREKRKCLNCEKVFLARQSKIKRGGGKYCSQSCKATYDNPGFKKGHGRIRSDESYLKVGEKISKAKMGTHLSEEHKKSISIKHLGRKPSEETKKRMSEAQYERWKNTVWAYKVTDRHGGHLYYQWRSDVFERDNWTCQTCGIKGVKLHPHHIYSWARFKDLRYVLENGVTLCEKCHSLTDNYKCKKGKNENC